MKSKGWTTLLVIGLFFLSAQAALAQGNGHGKGHEKHKDNDDDQGEYYFHKQDRDTMRGWYDDQHSHLPPGLAKKDQLPPGLEKQLIRNGSLPPGLQKKMYRCPEDLDRRLPPPPPDCGHFLVGGHVVLLNVRTNVVLDIFHFEIH